MTNQDDTSSTRSPIVANPTPLPSAVRLLGWASFLNDVASEMIFTQLPVFMLQVVGGNKVWLGTMEGAADAVASVLKLWSGARSDTVRRRKGMIVFGYAVAALTRPLIGLAIAPWQVLAMRIGDRIGKGVRSAPRDALIADVTDKTNRGRAFGFHRGMDHLGAAVGPLIALVFLLIWPDHLRTLFFLAVVPGIAVTLLVTRLREPHTAETVANELVATPLATPLATQAGARATLSRGFWKFLVVLLIFTLGNSADLFLLVRSQELGVPQSLLTVLWCLFHVVKSGGNVLAGRWVDRWGARPLLIGGWLLYAVIYFLFSVATTAWHAWVLFLAYAVYYALTEPAEKTIVAELAGANNKGAAFGWFNLTIGVGALPASLIFGGLYEWSGAVAAFGFGSVLALISSVLLWLVDLRSDRK